MTKIVLILLLIGHVLGDFYLQSNELALGKEDSIKKLLKHSVIYLLSMILVILPVFSFHLLKWVVIISISHLIVDLAKLLIKKKIGIGDKLEVAAYSIDQITHILIIVIIMAMIYIKSEPITYIGWIQNIVNKLEIDVAAIISWILILLIIIQPFSITIKKVLYNYKPISNREEEGSPNAGALIGILERCIILLLLYAGQYSAIGFVLTAKSIARYNKIADDPKFSEYYLLGTLLSAMLVIGAYLVIL